MDPVFVIFGAAGAVLFFLGGISYVYRPEVNPFTGSSAEGAPAQPSQKPTTPDQPLRIQAVRPEKGAPVPSRGVVYYLFGYPCHSWVIVKVPISQEQKPFKHPNGGTFCTNFMYIGSNFNCATYVAGYWLDDERPAAVSKTSQPNPAPTPSTASQPKDATDG